MSRVCMEIWNRQRRWRVYLKELAKRCCRCLPKRLCGLPLDKENEMSPIDSAACFKHTPATADTADLATWLGIGTRIQLAASFSLGSRDTSRLLCIVIRNKLGIF